MTDDPNDLLMRGGGAPSAKFPHVGATVKGTVTAFESGQQRDFETGDPMYWPNGDPKMQIIVTLQTGETDPDVENDTGERRIFAVTWAKPGTLFDAIRNAVRASGASRLEIGGTMAVQFVDEEPASRKGLNPRKIYRAQYQPPAGKANDLLDLSPKPTELI